MAQTIIWAGQVVAFTPCAQMAFCAKPLFIFCTKRGKAMPVNLSEGFYYLSSAQIRELIDVMEAFAKKHSIPDDAVPVILNAVARLALDAHIKHLRDCGATEADVQMYMDASGWTPMDAKQPSKDVN